MDRTILSNVKKWSRERAEVCRAEAAPDIPREMEFQTLTRHRAATFFLLPHLLMVGSPEMACEFLARPLAQVARQQSRFVCSARRLTPKAHPQPLQHLPAIRHSIQTPVLDFLLPSFAVEHTILPAKRYPKHIYRASLAAGKAQARRHFSTSPRACAVVVTANSRKDEDGNEMLIDITDRAANVRLPSPMKNKQSADTERQRLKEMMLKDSNPQLALRVTVESGGCHGFQYLMSLTNTATVSPEDDTIFEACNGSGAKVVMDEPSLELLKGSKVDFTMELIGSQFKIVGNPAATSSCGCGTSFDIKA